MRGRATTIELGKAGAAALAPLRAAGTLLDLVWRLAGDERLVRDALAAGYALTGTFRGREAELIESRPGTSDAEREGAR